MATANDKNEFDALKEFFKGERNKFQLQGKSKEFKEHVANNADLKKKFERWKHLNAKIKNPQTKEAVPLISVNNKRKHRKRRYSEIKYNELNTNCTNQRKKFKLTKYSNNNGFSPSITYNKHNHQPINTFSNSSTDNTIQNTSNITPNNQRKSLSYDTYNNDNNNNNNKDKSKENKENVQRVKHRKKRCKSMVNIETPLRQNVNSNNRLNRSNKGLLSSNRSSLKNRMHLKTKENNNENNEHMDSELSNTNINNNNECDEQKDIEMSNNESDVDYVPPSVNTPSNRNNKTKKKKANPQIAQTAKIRKKSIRSKSAKSKTCKKPQTTKRKTKKEGATISNNFHKMDLKHNYYTRKGRSKKNKKKSSFLSKWEWKEQQRIKRNKNNNLNLENTQQLKREIYSDSEEEENIDLQIENIGQQIKQDIVINPYADRLNNNNNNNNTDMDALLSDVLQTEYGYNSYRNGQRECIKKILNHESVLLLLSTGAGKSICYQIPTILMKNNNIKPLTLVVSPLISLMQDQCKNLPKCLTGAVWNSSKKSKEETWKLRNDVLNGVVDILFIAPEKLDSNYFRSFLRNKIGSQRLMFACIDEAHCISEWSHNFRPSYLKLKSILMDYLGVQCILACTATATVITQNSIIANLNIASANIISKLESRNNLHLSVSHIGKTVDKLYKLQHLLCTDRFKDLNSLIVYASTRREVDSIALKLSLLLRRRYGVTVEAYHAGKKTEEREEIQNKFMCGKVNIIVATIAFGMGINKSDIRGIIHYSMPKTMEHYVQEIGRAGRDGYDSQCHMFYDLGDIEINKSRIYMNGLDLTQIKRILFDVFSAKNVKILRNKNRKKTKNMIKNRIKSKSKKQAIHDFSDEDFSESDTDTENENENELVLTEFRPANDIITIHKSSEIEKRYDAKQVVLKTIFTYLDVYKSEYLKLLPSHHNKIKIGIMRNEKQLIADSEIIKYIVNAYKPKNGQYIIHLNKLYNDLRCIELEDENGDQIEIENNWTVYGIIKHLKDLEWKRKVALCFDDDCFVLMIKKQLNNHKELIDLCNEIYNYVSNHEKSELEKINTLAQALKIIANNNEHNNENENENNNNNNNITLHELVDKYFKCVSHDEFLDFVQSFLPSYDHIRTLPVSKDNVIYSEVKESIKTFMQQNPSIKRVRSIAKIFHGFGSPLFSWKIWKNDKYWKKHVNFPFMQIIQIAKDVIKEKKNKKNNMENNDYHNHNQ